MPSYFFFLPLIKKHKATGPVVLRVKKNTTTEATANHNHIQLHSSQKTVYICSPHRTYFKVTK